MSVSRRAKSGGFTVSVVVVVVVAQVVHVSFRTKLCVHDRMTTPGFGSRVVVDLDSMSPAAAAAVWCVLVGVGLSWWARPQHEHEHEHEQHAATTNNYYSFQANLSASLSYYTPGPTV